MEQPLHAGDLLSRRPVTDLTEKSGYAVDRGAWIAEGYRLLGICFRLLCAPEIEGAEDVNEIEHRAVGDGARGSGDAWYLGPGNGCRANVCPTNVCPTRPQPRSL